MAITTGPRPAFGSTLTLSTASYAFQITNFSHDGYEVDALETTHMGTTGGHRTYTPSDLKSPGTWTIEGHCLPNLLDAMKSAMGVAQTITVGFDVESGEATGATIAASGFLQSHSIDMPRDDLASVSSVWQLSGDVTFTDAST